MVEEALMTYDVWLTGIGSVVLEEDRMVGCVAVLRINVERSVVWNHL